MYHNRAALTGRALADKYRRSPGWGRFKRYLQDVEREMEREEQKAAAGTMRERITAQLLMLRTLFKPRAKQPFKAARAK
jgi:hypothetical protein